MQHVLIIPSWFPSRHRPITGIFFKEQAEILSKKIPKVGLISPLFRSLKDFDRSRNKSEFKVVDGVITYTKEIWHYPFVKKINNANWFKTCKLLFEKYISENGIPEVIHIQSITIAGEIAAYIKDTYNIPFVVTEHATGFALNTYNKKELKHFREILTRSSINIAVSEGLAKTLHEVIGGDWAVIPNTIQNTFFDNVSKQPHFPKNKNKKVFFSLSNLIPIKGIGILVDSFSKLLKDYDNIELWIGGDGSEKHNIEKQIKELSISDKIFLLGRIDRNIVLEKLKEADFYVSPSLQETFGIVIIEALAMGLPTIATRCGGPEYIITDDVGVITEKGSVDKLYSAMKFILENENKYDREKIIEYCRQNYSEEVIGEQIIKAFKKSLNG